MTLTEFALVVMGPLLFLGIAMVAQLLGDVIEARAARRPVDGDRPGARHG
jgi:hypothetical protein